MSDLCRLCGVLKDLYEFSDLNDSELLIDFKLKSCFNISLTSEKLMPQNVCSECIQCLEKSFDFHQNILNVQEELSQNIKPNVKQEVLDNSMECVVLLEQIPIELLRRSTRKRDTIPEFVSITPTNKIEKVKVKKEKLVKIPKMKLSVPAQKKIIWSKYIWKCHKCDMQFNDITLLEQHHVESHSNQLIKYCCFSCDRAYLKRQSIINHIITHQPSLKFCCLYCSEYHTSFVNLYHHYTQNHPTSTVFLCLYCGLNSESGSIALGHRKLHFDTTQYSCDLCGKHLKSKISMISHIEMTHSTNITYPRNFTCEICGSSFKNKASLSGHQLIHSNKLFQCQICRKELTTMQNLRYHVKRHLNIKNEICPVCGKAFASKSRLKMHNRIHEDIYPYNCEVCGKKYKFAHCFKTHSYTHTGEKPYSCLDEYCTMRFTNWPNFNKHMKTTHGRDMSTRKKIQQDEEIYFAKPTNSVLNHIQIK
ncbi:unnamed protein product [Diamesa hyperborea]